MAVNAPESYELWQFDIWIFMNYGSLFVGDNLGYRLETIVYIELLRRTKPLNQNVFYLKEQSGEADFLVCDKNTVLEVIQVSYDISNEATRRREINGLILGAQKTRCKKLTLITRHNHEQIVEKGYNINIVPAYDWLVDLGK